jgi:hypothetical protein
MNARAVQYNMRFIRVARSGEGAIRRRDHLDGVLKLYCAAAA